MKLVNAAVLCLSLVSFSAPSFAKVNSQDSSRRSQKRSAVDTKALIAFRSANTLDELHHTNLLEIRLATLARDKTTRSDVKDFSEMLIQDHQKADADLTTLAAQQNIKLADFIGSEAEVGTLGRLQQLTGTDFDLSYIDFQRMAHAEVATKLRHKIVQEKDLNMRQTLRDNHKTVVEHQMAAAKIERAILAGK